MKEWLEMEIIDSHCHIYPEKIAAKAVQAIGDFYQIGMKCNGTVGELNSIMDKYNISRAVVHSTATKPEQVPGINNYIIDTVNENERFIGYGTMHAFYEKKEEEFEKIRKAGLKGIKIHPDFQKINIDDKKMDDIYELASDDMPILFHIGDKERDFSNPERLLRVIKRFPKLKPIAAHMGGYRKWNESADMFKGRDVWFDTCSSFTYLTDENIKAIINSQGIDKILFATDYPMWNFEDEYKRLISLNFKDEDIEKILSGNIKMLLKI